MRTSLLIALMATILAKPTILANGQTLTNDKYSITKLSNQETIFLEYLEKIRMFHEEWKLVIGFDFTHVEDELIKLKSLYQYVITDLCIREIEGQHFVCSVKLRIEKRLKDFGYIRGELRNAFYAAGIESSSSSRVRRGIFNFIGEISKTLFGTLDETDAKYYNDELDKLYADQKSIINYVRNQTSIILNSMRSNMAMFKSTNDQIAQINLQFNKLRDLSKLNEMNIQIDNIVLDLEVAIDEVRDRIRKIEDLVFDAKRGTVKPYVLPPERLFEILREHKHIDNFPVPFEETSYLSLIDICDINFALNGKRILLEIKIPLLELNTFNLIKVISLPIHGWIFHSVINETHNNASYY